MKNFPPTDVAEAACLGQSELFDSRNREDHLKAKALCNSCPIALQCVAHLQDVLASPKSEGGTPEGTWAGKLMGRPDKPTERAKCGTEQGYHQHRHYDEMACQPCLDARAVRQRARAKARKEKTAA